jgi:hypothetical protein
MMIRVKKLARNVDVVSGGFLLIFCALFIFWLIPAFVESKPAALMPQIAVCWIAVFSVLLIHAGLRQSRTGQRSDEEAALIDKADLGAGESLHVLLLFVIWGIHIFLLPILGYYLGGMLVLSASMLVLRKRSYIKTIVWMFGSLVVMYALFEKSLQLRLPKGHLVEALIAAIF